MQLLLALLGAAMAVAPLYDQRQSDVMNLNQLNFDTQITKLLGTGSVSVVHFYSNGDGRSPSMKAEFERFAKDLKGIFKVGAVNCDESAHLCDKHDASVADLPKFRIFPPMPMPAFHLAEDFTYDALKKIAARHIQAPPITELTDTNIQGFLRENESFPKSLLFTKSKGTPLLYKALAKDFKDTLLFGVVRADNEQLKRRFKIKELPSLIVVENPKKQPERFTGKMNFHEMFQFLNVYSQVFVLDDSKSGGKKMTDLSAKPWLTARLPQLTVQSADELCFDRIADNTICMLHVGNAPSDSEMDVLQAIRAFYEPKGDRGAKLASGWMDSKLETEWLGLLGLEQGKTGVAFVKGKKAKPRFFLHSGDYTVEGLKHSVDKIMGGDARFKIIKSRPGFTASYQEGSAAGGKTEDL